MPIRSDLVFDPDVKEALFRHRILCDMCNTTFRITSTNTDDLDHVHGQVEGKIFTINVSCPLCKGYILVFKREFTLERITT